MVPVIPKIEFPELFIGFVAPIGADIKACITDFRRYLEGFGYQVVELKVTDVFRNFARNISPEIPLKQKPLQERYDTHISYGNQLRNHFKDDAILSAVTIGRIIRRRLKLRKPSKQERFTRTAFLLHQFKRQEEIDLLRSVYGRLFFQVSIYSRRGARVQHLSRKFAESENSANVNSFRSDAEQIIQRDENENDDSHGQRVSKIFHDADFIVNLDIDSPNSTKQIEYFCQLLFGSNRISPNKIEYGMFMAKAAALRTLDLSRQVGAAIFSASGEVISMGSNEVPKATGGTYWCDDPHDDREYVRGIDSNDKRKREILGELAEILAPAIDIDQLLGDQRIKESQFMDALEYGRIVHAEMSALIDAARLGRPTKDGVIFCTTFPCHMCAKHIIASGIARVVFLEPYPKSLASELHGDALSIEGSDRGEFAKYPAVEFSHFYGISPRRYREMFERSRRKDSHGNFLEWSGGTAMPMLDIRDPFYVQLEERVLAYLGVLLKSFGKKEKLLD